MALAVVVGVVGGIYGIGGGSILGPILVARGVPVSRVAPATLASAFVTSVAGAVTYGLLTLVAPGDIAPNWTVGLSCGLGGLLGGYAGARLQPRLPERSLRLLLGALATQAGVVERVQDLADSGVEGLHRRLALVQVGLALGVDVAEVVEGAVEVAEEDVEAGLERAEPGQPAAVPLAVHGGVVAGVLEQRGQGGVLVRDAAVLGALGQRFLQAGGQPARVASGVERDAGG